MRIARPAYRVPSKALTGTFSWLLWYPRNSLIQLPVLYIKKEEVCVDTAVRVKCCKTYPNNKRWVSKQIKEVVKRRVYFKGGGGGGGGVTQSKVKRKIKKATEAYKDKTEATHTTERKKKRKKFVCVCLCAFVVVKLWCPKQSFIHGICHVLLCLWLSDEFPNGDNTVVLHYTAF